MINFEGATFLGRCKCLAELVNQKYPQLQPTMPKHIELRKVLDMDEDEKYVAVVNKLEVSILGPMCNNQEEAMFGLLQLLS